MTVTEGRAIATTVNLGPTMSDRLRELAAAHQRDFAGEARAAVRAWLELHEREPERVEQ